MNASDPSYHRITEQGVQEDLQRQRHLLMKLAENALTVAQSLRNNYFKNTAKFVSHLRRAMYDAEIGERTEPPLTIHKLDAPDWSTVHNEVVTFIDGGLGQAQISSQVPILLRVGSYCVRIGERRLTERENFGYYPVIFGDVEGGSKERRDFPDIIRITAELLGGLSALQRTPDLRMLMFHGPLVYMMSGYAGHTPFTEQDIDLFLGQYAPDPESGRQLKEGFLREARVNIYPQMTPGAAREWSDKRIFEPLAWISYLYRCLIAEAKQRTPTPIIAGVVERGELREFSQHVLLERIFISLRSKGKEDYFNQLFGRTDLNSPEQFLNRLGYTDALLLAMLMQPGDASEHWEISKYSGLTKGNIVLPGESKVESADFGVLKPGRIGFPRVTGCYVQISETTEPVRVEVFSELGGNQILDAAFRAYLYGRLLPGYGFPVGLDIADKYAHVPNWMTSAYSKLIQLELGVSLQRGDISDAEMRRILIQSIYMTHRDWLFRPKS